MKPVIYIETTVASYLAARPTRDHVMMARQLSTHAWWGQRLESFTPVISQLVLDEAQRGDPLAAQRRLKALEGLPLLAVNPGVMRLAQQLVRPGALPPKAADDAAHLAICAVHRVPFLLTWNFRHLANSELQESLQRICTIAGFDLPTICSPDEFP